MQVFTTTKVRANIKTIVDRAKYRGETFGIGRRDSIDAIVIGFPSHFNAAVNDITNVNAYSKSFDFLSHEPELYSVADVKKRYA